MFTVRLADFTELSSSTRKYRFVRTDGLVTRYKPGQFFRFVFADENGEFERSYSLCNFKVLYGDELDLVVSKVEAGRATNLLFADNIEGLEATVSGPYGRLVNPVEPPGRLLLVATSVGLAPYLPILRELESLDFPRVELLLGIRDRSEFIYGDLLLDYADKHDWFHLHLCLSREVASGTYEFNGYVTDRLQQLDVNPESDFVLLCGNPNMIDDAWKFLGQSGFSAKQVVREKYVFAREKQRPASGPTDEQKRLIAEKLKKYRPED